MSIGKGEKPESPASGNVSCQWRGEILAIVFIMSKTKEISVFVDESGSFDPDRSSSRYYLVCMVFHNQETDISSQIAILEQNLERIGLPSGHCVHAGPLIRREKEYASLGRQERRGIFDRMMVFVRTCDIEYTCFRIDKALIGSRQELHDPLLQQIVGFLIRHMNDLNTYDVLKVYYDNGQHELSALLKEAFAIYASRTQFVRDVSPERYKLFQVADLACTLELTALKLNETGTLSPSESLFFGGAKNFRKNFLKPLRRKQKD